MAVRPRSELHLLSTEVEGGTSPRQLLKRPVGLRSITLGPPRRFEFDNQLLRLLLDRLEHQGYCDKSRKAVHVSVFRRTLRRLLDTIDEDAVVDTELFRSQKDPAHPEWLVWEDIRFGILSGAFPTIELTVGERISKTVEDSESSQIARVWAVFIMVAITINVSLIILHSFDDVCPVDADGNRCFHELSDATVVVFSIEYLVKLVCSPWCRRATFDRDWHLSVAVPDASEPMGPYPGLMTKAERILMFVLQPLNLIDLISIIPFWLHVLLSNTGLPLSFLRALRLTRFIRMVKMGKFNDNLMVLGSTLTRSLSSVYVLGLYVFLSCLVVGAVLQQAEADNPGETGMFPDHTSFTTVPEASWWVLARMLEMQKNSVAWSRDVVDSILGAAVVCFLMPFKKMLFIMPYGQIGQVFRESSAETRRLKKIRTETDREDTRPHDCAWIEAFDTPIVYVRVYACKEGDVAAVLPAGSDLVPTGFLPVPIWKDRATEATAKVLFNQGSKGRAGEIEFDVDWTPSSSAHSGPTGILRVRPLLGRDLPVDTSAATTSWALELQVPISLFGENRTQRWMSKCSTGSALNPVWDEDFEEFHIAWGSAVSPGSPPTMTHVARAPAQEGSAGDASDAEEILDLQLMKIAEAQDVQLSVQSKQLAAIEASLLEASFFD